jgi:hypothetical protein
VEKAKKKRKRTGKGDIDGKENVFRWETEPEKETRTTKSLAEKWTANFFGFMAEAESLY